MLMRRALSAVVVVLFTMVMTTACGGDSAEGDATGPETTSTASSTAGPETTTPTEGSTADHETIEVTFSGDTVTPSGERVDVRTDQPIDLVVTADRPGEIHVHSDPEQTFSYDEGTRTFTFQISRPGVVEVESHDLDMVIVQLEVR
jgi:hypothetical protein